MNLFMQDKGIETFQKSLPDGKIKQVFFFDPDGNLFRFILLEPNLINNFNETLQLKYIS